MPTETKAPEPPWTPEQAVLIDHVGNEVYASHYAERKMSRFVIGVESFLLVCAMLIIALLANRKVVYRYVRIDEMGRANAIAYNDLNYSPREGEINRETVAKKYPLNYYFLSQQLSSQLMAEDNASHLVSQVLGGQIEQADVEVKGVTITSMSEENVAGSNLARGAALVNIDRLYSPRYSREPRTEHWVLSITYYLNPKQVSDQSKVFPQFETINPLGMTITEFHENRVSVGPFGPGAPEAPATVANTAAGVTH
jgi:type IV secretion system protein VirB5